MKTNIFNLMQCIVGILLLTAAVQAQNFVQTKSLISSGGQSSGEGYELQGSMGQVNTQHSSNEQYALQAGYWQQNNDLIFQAEFE